MEELSLCWGLGEALFALKHTHLGKKASLPVLNKHTIHSVVAYTLMLSKFCCGICLSALESFVIVFLSFCLLHKHM